MNGRGCARAGRRLPRGPGLIDRSDRTGPGAEIMATSQTVDSRSLYASAFTRMAWAFPFTALGLAVTFNFGGFGTDRFSVDLLPDVVGYILIASGANRLLDLHPRARGIRNLALILNYMAIPSL